MAKKKATDTNAEQVKPGTQPKRGPKGSQSAAMNWLSARMEGHPSSSQARLRRGLGDAAYKKISSRPNDPSPVEAARRRREDASTVYSKLHLLGRALVERRKQTSHDQPGQGSLPFPNDPGTHQKGSRRNQRATPRRRKGEGGRRAIDKPTDSRPKGFDVKAQGSRTQDLSNRAAEAATSAAATALQKQRHVAGRSPEKVAAALHFGERAGRAIRSAVKPVRFKNRTGRARKQNPHTATSPID